MILCTGNFIYGCIYNGNKGKSFMWNELRSIDKNCKPREHETVIDCTIKIDIEKNFYASNCNLELYVQ